MNRFGSAGLAAGLLLLIGCGDDSGSRNGPGPVEITLVAYDSFATSKDVFDSLRREEGITVKVITAGDTGELVNKAILTKGKPLGDVLWGVDTTFLSRALDAGIFEPFTADRLPAVDRRFQRLVPGGEATPVDFGDVCVNFDKAALAKAGVAPPTGLDDLIDPARKGQLVLQDPATSSPGLAFLLATVAKYGDPGWKDYWRKLRANGAKVVSGWDQAYNGEFTAGGGGGKYPMVVSYASSPPAAVLFGPDPKAIESPTAAALETCYRQVEFAAVLRGTKKREAAQRVIEFLLSDTFQGDMPLNMFVFPVVSAVTLPEAFVKFAEVPARPYELEPDRIAKNRDRWIEEWKSIVLG